MVTRKLFRSDNRVVNDQNAGKVDSHNPSPRPNAFFEERMSDFEEHLAHLSKQKELHSLALKEMYQFLCKLDASYRAETQRLQELIKAEQNRSAKLVEITKGLWEIIEMMDKNAKEPVQLANLSKDIERFNAVENEAVGASNRAFADRRPIDEIMPMVGAS